MKIEISVFVSLKADDSAVMFPSEKHFFCRYSFLIGHAIVAMGEKYTIVMENGPARRKAMARNIQVSTTTTAASITTTTTLVTLHWGQ